MMFGALKKCPECGDGQLVFRSGVGYQCMGDVSEWTKCQHRQERTPDKTATIFNPITKMFY